MTAPPARLPDSAERALRRIVELALAKATVRVEIELHEGGVRSFSESRSFRTADLPEGGGAPGVVSLPGAVRNRVQRPGRTRRECRPGSPKL